MTLPAEQDHGKRLMELFVQHLLQVLEKPSEDGIPAATLGVIRTFLSDNSITLAHVKRGDFGEFAKNAAEEFPFDENGARKH